MKLPPGAVHKLQVEANASLKSCVRSAPPAPAGCAPHPAPPSFRKVSVRPEASLRTPPGASHAPRMPTHAIASQSAAEELTRRTHERILANAKRVSDFHAAVRARASARRRAPHKTASHRSSGAPAASAAPSSHAPVRSARAAGPGAALG